MRTAVIPALRACAVSVVQVRVDQNRASVRSTAAVTALLLTVLTGGCAVTSTRPSADDESVTGPEWKTTARSGVGAATVTAPARLLGVAAEDHERYDRIVFSFGGERPGYDVAYSAWAGRGTDQRLRITLDRVSSNGERWLTPRLAAVREVQQRPDADLVVDTIVSVAASDPDDRLPFRVGLSVAGFYVDVAHPDERT